MKYLVITSILALSALWVNAQTADEALVFGYCGNYATSLGTTDASIKTESAAIEIPQELAETWKSAQLTKVIVGYGVSSVKEITLFISESIQAEPFYTQSAKMTVSGGWNEVMLETPLKIEGDAFVVGYTTNVNSTNDKPIGVDNIKTSETYGAWVNTYGNWENVGKYYGNVCLRLGLVGDNLPQYDVEASSLETPPVVTLDKPFDLTFNIVNNGLKTVNSIEVELKIDGETINDVNVALDAPVVSAETGLVTLSGVVCSTPGADLPIEVTVTKVNGYEDETPVNNVVNGLLNCAEKTFKQNVLVEEFTGTWCGWCPLGIVGMAYMREKYGEDGFVGVAVHIGDPMAVEPYATYALSICNSQAPSAFLDRKLYFLEPSSETLEELFLAASKYPAAAGINVTADYSEEDNALVVTSVAEFSFNQSDAPYEVAYVIKEDDFGPYLQTNYFSGGNGADYLEGWSNNRGEVPTLFNEVAREIKDVYGIEESLPSEISAGVSYEYSTTLPLDNVEDLNKCEVVALLLDTTTGEVVNCSQATINNADAGVEDLESDPFGGVLKVYNPQGVKMMETKDPSMLNLLPSGIYIINGKKVKL